MSLVIFERRRPRKPRKSSVLHGFKPGAIVTAESGRHFNIFACGDSNVHCDSNSDRPGRLGHNTLLGPKYASVDVRIGRVIKFKEWLSSGLRLDFFSLFDRTNIRDLNKVYGGIDLSAPPIASFNTMRGVFNPRQRRFGVISKFLRIPPGGARRRAG